ncbi:hypothetical protein FGO68_gene16211 [Halteria grandinella]|uniref:Uncharacterized protein n=1 Tax=Halteria grandinella TaxID=5974 RepID=A0A8J8NCP6_HALGN|nr:hypothetical protein FGO68_gene16211 [Halteria grandinella]
MKQLNNIYENILNSAMNITNKPTPQKDDTDMSVDLYSSHKSKSIHPSAIKRLSKELRRASQLQEKDIFLDNIIEEMIALNNHMKERKLKSPNNKLTAGESTSPRRGQMGVDDNASSSEESSSFENYDDDWHKPKKEMGTEQLIMGKPLVLRAVTNTLATQQISEEDEEYDDEWDRDNPEDKSQNLFNRLLVDHHERERQRKNLAERRQAQIKELGWDSSDGSSDKQKWKKRSTTRKGMGISITTPGMREDETASNSQESSFWKSLAGVLFLGCGNRQK